jgi:hypothetical protein
MLHVEAAWCIPSSSRVIAKQLSHKPNRSLAIRSDKGLKHFSALEHLLVIFRFCVALHAILACAVYFDE